MGVLVHVVPFAWLKGVIVLRFHVATADLNRVQFVSSRSPPGTASPRCPRAGRRGSRFSDYGDALLLTGLGGEVGGVLPVLREFTAKDNVLATGAKDACEGDDVELVGSVDQRIGCQLRRVKAAWARGRRIRSSRRLLGRGLLRERRNRNA